MSSHPLARPESSAVVAGECLAGRYRLDEVLGAGGMSIVFKAFDGELERVVAVKVLHAGMIDSVSLGRFRREAVIGASLGHENIVAVLDCGSDGGRPFIVLEFAGPANLKELLAGKGPLPLDLALELTIQVAHGLAFAHAHGCIHRDVKPQNILVDGATAKLADFGIARSLIGEDAPTVTGVVVGSADYISPEQAQGRDVDERSDVYSLGAVLYELLTGETPFAGESFVAIAMQHVTSPPPAPRRLRPVPPCVDLAVRRALAKDPRQRFPTMQAFAAELEACLARSRGVDGSDTAIVPTREETRRRRRGAVAAVSSFALLAALVAVAGVYLPGGQKKPVQTAAVTPPRAAAAVRTLVAVPLHAVSADDPPPGDGVEDNAALPLATDRKTGTAWSTESYATAAFGNLKRGVGIVLDAGETASLDSITVLTDTPGIRAEVETGAAASGPFRPASKPVTIGGRTTIDLDRNARARYVLLWITALSPTTGPRFRADVSEVFGRGPAHG